MDMLMALAVSIGVLIALWVKVGAMASLAVPAGIVAFILVIQSKLPALSFIPGAFCGAAVTAWAAPADPKGYLMVAVALVAGAVLGYISEMGAGMIAKKA